MVRKSGLYMMKLKGDNSTETDQIAFFDKISIIQGEKVARIEVHFVVAPSYLIGFRASHKICLNELSDQKNGDVYKKCSEKFLKANKIDASSKNRGTVSFTLVSGRDQLHQKVILPRL